MEDKIKEAIEAALSPHEMQLMNQSAKHAGHAGDDGSGQTHFELIVVSDQFLNRNRVQRQRMVNAAVCGLFSEGLHAFSMKLYTLEEYNI